MQIDKIIKFFFRFCSQNEIITQNVVLKKNIKIYICCYMP